MSLYQGLVRVSGTPRFTFVISVRRWKFPERFSISTSWISISLSVVYMSISIFLNSFRTGCLPIRSSKAAEAYELPAPVSSGVRHRIPQTSTTTTGYVTLFFSHVLRSFVSRDVLADGWVVSPSAVWTFRNAAALLSSVIWTGAVKT